MRFSSYQTLTEKKSKPINSGYSLVVSHLTTDRPAHGLSTAGTWLKYGRANGKACVPCPMVDCGNMCYVINIICYKNKINDYRFWQLPNP